MEDERGAESGRAVSDRGLTGGGFSDGSAGRGDPEGGFNRGVSQEGDVLERGVLEGGFAERVSGRRGSEGAIDRLGSEAGFSGRLERASHSMPLHVLLGDSTASVAAQFEAKHPGAVGPNKPSLNPAYSLPVPKASSSNPFLNPGLTSPSFTNQPEQTLPAQSHFPTQSQTLFDGPWLQPPTSTSVQDLNPTLDPTLTQVDVPLLSPTLDENSEGRTQLPRSLSLLPEPFHTSDGAFSHQRQGSFTPATGAVHTSDRPHSGPLHTSAGAFLHQPRDSFTPAPEPVHTGGGGRSHPRGWQSFDAASLEAPQRLQEALDASDRWRFSLGGADIGRGLPGRSVDVSWGLPAGSAVVSRGLSAGSADVSRGLSAASANVSRGLPARSADVSAGLAEDPSNSARLEATDSRGFGERGNAANGERDLGAVRQTFESRSDNEAQAAGEADEGGGETRGEPSHGACFKFPKSLATWRPLPPRIPDRPKLISTAKTTIFALWAVAVMGVVPFVNTITNAWFLAILYQPRVLNCIDFVEGSPGADPSEFPIINGALLQALSWICVILGLIDIGDLLTRLALHLRKQGVPLWRVRPLVWATIKWLMREDERSTHLEGYTHARVREFLFSTGADTIEVFVTASFLFWTGSGYPLATFSLFISLAAIYLTWSFEIAWHIWYLGRRFSPIWPHPMVDSPEDSAAQLLGNQPKQRKGWFRERRGSGRIAAESEDGSTERGGENAGTEQRPVEDGRSWRDSPEKQSKLSLTTGLNELGVKRVDETLGTGIGSVKGEVVNEAKVKSGLKGINRRTEPVELLERQNRQKGLFATASMPIPDSDTGLERASEPGLEGPRVGEQGNWRREGSGGGHVARRLRHQRTRSLEDVDVELGLIRTLSDVAIRVSAGRSIDNPDETALAERQQRGESLTEVGALVNDNPGEETGTSSGGSSGGHLGRDAAPRKRKVVGRSERYLFRCIRGLILLGMIAALVVALWLADFGPGVLYGVGITYLTRISTQVQVRCEPFDAPGTTVEYLVPFSGSRVLNLDGVFFYYTAASNAYIFDSSDDELNSITEHDFVVGAVSDRVVSYDWSGSANRTSAGGIKIRFATILRGVAMLVSTSDAWARRVSFNVTGRNGTEGESAPPGVSTKFLIDPVKLNRYHPLNQRFVFNYDLATWQTQPIDVAQFGVPVFCRSPYSNATISPLGRLMGLTALVSMAGVSCYNPGNATFKMPKEPVRPPKTNAFY